MSQHISEVANTVDIVAQQLEGSLLVSFGEFEAFGQSSTLLQNPLQRLLDDLIITSGPIARSYRETDHEHRNLIDKVARLNRNESRAKIDMVLLQKRAARMRFHTVGCYRFNKSLIQPEQRPPCITTLVSTVNSTRATLICSSRSCR